MMVFSTTLTFAVLEVQLKNLVAVRAYRILRPLENYTDLVVSEALEAANISLADGETAIGIYQLSDKLKETTIFVTNLGLHFYREDSWQFVNYKSIVTVQAPEDKASRRGLALCLHSGGAIEINVSGGEGKYRDRYEFMRFLRRVIRDLW